MDEIDTVLNGMWELLKTTIETLIEITKEMGSALLKSAGFIINGFKGAKK